MGIVPAIASENTIQSIADKEIWLELEQQDFYTTGDDDVMNDDDALSDKINIFQMKINSIEDMFSFFKHKY